MRKAFAMLGIAGVLGLAAAGGALAGSDNHAAPGAPGDKNCVGQTNAYLAQVGTEEGIHGLGGIAHALDVSVQDIQAIVQAYCAGS
jgi:hypothetical protein